MYFPLIFFKPKCVINSHSKLVNKLIVKFPKICIIVDNRLVRASFNNVKIIKKKKQRGINPLMKRKPKFAGSHFKKLSDQALKRNNFNSKLLN